MPTSPRTSATVLLCPPTHFDIVYEINPWMDVGRRADRALALRQWEALREVVSSVAEVRLIDPVEGAPDLVFTANAGLVSGKTVILSRFRHPQRQVEEPHWRRFFAENGYDVLVPEGCSFEGAGDALFVGDVLVGGYGGRTEPEAYAWIRRALGIEVLPVRLVDERFYHLDTCFCPLDDRTVFLYPGAFDAPALELLRERFSCIEVTEEEAARFACNAVVLGRDVILAAGCPVLTAELERRGYAVHGLEFSEFLKSGGSAKCLTLRI